MNIVRIIKVDSVFYNNKGALVEIDAERDRWGVRFNGIETLFYFSRFDFEYIIK